MRISAFTTTIILHFSADKSWGTIFLQKNGIGGSEAKDLVEKLLVVALPRLDIDGILQHPWMTSEDLSNVVLERVRSNEKNSMRSGSSKLVLWLHDGAKVTRNWKEVKCPGSAAAFSLWKRVLYTDS